MKLENRELLKSEAGRKWLIEKTLEAVPKENNWQNFHTPYDLCEHMISKTTLEGKSILVLFNVEFLEVLIHKFGVSSENITFLADCRIESELASKVYKVNNTIVNNIDDIKRELKKLKAFDLCFSNPPYLKNTHLKIISCVYLICDEIIVVQPQHWSLDSKGVFKAYSDFINQIENSIKSIEIFNGNVVFDIAQAQKMGITHINKNHSGIKKIIYFDKYFEVSSVSEITKFAEKWNFVQKNFIEKILFYIKDEESKRLKNHIINAKQRDIKKYHCQIASLIGTPSKSSEGYNERYDYYTLLPKGVETNKIRNENWVTTFEFETEDEVDNFCNYLRTKFSRFCLSIYKNGLDVGKNEIQLIPWLDFTQPWNNEKLYSYFDIDEEMQKYIEEFLPDYYKTEVIS